MLEGLEKFPAQVKSITISSKFPDEAICEDKFIVGYYKKNSYRSLLYFNLDDLYEEKIYKIFLKLYLIKRYFFPKTIFIHALLDEFREDYTYNNHPKFEEKFIEINLCNYRDGYVIINLMELFQRWKIGEIKNNGILLKSNEIYSSLNIFASYKNNNLELVPEIYVGYSNSKNINKCKYFNKCIITEEKEWDIEFYNTGVTEAIDVFKLHKGSFFITNMGGQKLNAQIEVSGDKINWIKDNFTVIYQKETEILIPYYFGKYYRIKLATIGRGRVLIKFISQNFL